MIGPPLEPGELELELARLAALLADPSTPGAAHAQLRARLALLQQALAQQAPEEPAG